MTLKGCVFQLDKKFGLIFHIPTRRAYVFKPEKGVKISEGQEVQFKLKRKKKFEYVVTDITPTDVFHGQIIYLDPTNKSLSSLAGEVGCDKERHLFLFAVADNLKIGMFVRFRINKDGMAEIISSYASKPA